MNADFELVKCGEILQGVIRVSVDVMGKVKVWFRIRVRLTVRVRVSG